MSSCEATVVETDGETLGPCSRPAVGMRQDLEVGAWPACELHLAARYLGDGVWTL